MNEATALGRDGHLEERLEGPAGDLFGDPQFDPLANPPAGSTTDPSTDDSTGAPRGARRRTVAVVATLVVVLAAGTGAVLISRRDPRPAVATTVSGPTAPITRETLATTVSLPGELGYGSEGTLPVKATGTITWLPAGGTVLRRGDAVARVDDRPVILLVGRIPMYRVLEVPEPVVVEPPASGDGTGGSGNGTGDAGQGAAEGTAEAGTQPSAGQPTSGQPTSAQPANAQSANAQPTTVQPPPIRGRDVLQFERNLRALGYRGFTVDATYTERTAHAVRRWQADAGMQVTGKVGPAQIVYRLGPLRVDHALAGVGDEAGGDLLATTATSKIVTLDVPVSDAAWAVRGTRVSVVLPGDKKVPGTVASVSDQADPGQVDGESGQGADAGATAVRDATLRVVVRPAQKGLAKLDRAPVDVRYTGERHRDVLTVPVTALLALAEGGYGIEVVEGGTSRVVAVTAGLFADGRVEIDAPGLAEGQSVRLPG